MMGTLPERKNPRLKDFDYSTAGAYFITICTKDRRNLFWKPVGATIGRPPLSEMGKIAEQSILNIPKYYSSVSVDHYVIMPNHIHLLLMLHGSQSGRPMVAPTVGQVIQQFKGSVSKKIGFSCWQKSFYDHIIRNQTDYNEIWGYIENNPLKWAEDRFFE